MLICPRTILWLKLRPEPFALFVLPLQEITSHFQGFEIADFLFYLFIGEEPTTDKLSFRKVEVCLFQPICDIATIPIVAIRPPLCDSLFHWLVIEVFIVCHCLCPCLFCPLSFEHALCPEDAA